MNYLNESTLQADIASNAGFRLSALHPGSEVARALRSVSESALERRAPESGALDTVCRIFGCGAEDAVVLAILAHYDGYLSSLARLASLGGHPLPHAEASLARLSGMGLVNQLRDAPAVILSETAILCIRRSVPVERIPDLGIIDVLRQTDPEITLTTDSFERFLSMRGGPGKIGAFVRDNGLQDLPHKEQVLFWNICRSYLLHFTAPFSGEFSEKDMSELVRRGWVETFASSGDTSDLTKKNNYCLSSTVAGRLFAGMDELVDYAIISTLGTFKSWKDLDEKPLFFCECDRGEIEALRRITGEQEFRRICVGFEERRLKMSVSAVLYGAPGTGKTELVRQIARSSKRNLVMVDASKLHGSYWGEDERNFRDLFRLFRHVAAVSSLAPILFIDEAEGLLGKRVANASSRADRSSNVVQNIILEELNDFKGILLITTNDVRNLDHAMDRRFLKKIEFHLPDEQTRRRIWQHMMPSLDEETLSAVARDFPFSGGHIENVVRNASIDEVLDGVSISADALMEYCRKEETFTATSTVKKIGF